MKEFDSEIQNCVILDSLKTVQNHRKVVIFENSENTTFYMILELFIHREQKEIVLNFACGISFDQLCVQ